MNKKAKEIIERRLAESRRTCQREVEAEVFDAIMHGDAAAAPEGLDGLVDAEVDS